MRSILPSIAVAVALQTGLAYAQDAMFSTLAGDTANNILNTSVRNSMLGVDTRTRRVSPPAGLRVGSLSRPRVRADVPASTRYSADPSVTARVQHQFVDFVRSRSGAPGAEAMARAFASQDLLQSWARQAAPDGMRLGDVSDALAEYWVTNWLIVHGLMDAPPAAVIGVRSQVHATLAADPGFGRLSNAQRQEMAEALIYNTLVQGEVFGAAVKRHDRALSARAADAAAARFRNEMKIDLRRLQLTDRGFVSAG